MVRDTLNSAVQTAEELHDKEAELVQKLHHIDQHRFYLRYGYKTLGRFCYHGLKFTKVQTQRILTLVRRYEPTVNISD
jgi:hypothetical protein